MIPIQIDISPILSSYKELEGKSNEIATTILDRVTEAYIYEWEALVGSGLKSTRRDYLSAMFVDRVDEFNVVIGLKPSESNLALMLEEGASPFDIKEGMENSSKKKMKADGGWYITVPFRHATTEALGESSLFSSKLPKQIYKSALNQPVNVVTGNSVPLRSSDLPSKYQKILGNSRTGYEHKSPIYAGLTRIDNSSSKNENRGGYMTFRRVSDKSDEDSWQHPGFTPKKFMEQALGNIRIDDIVSNVIDEFVEGL